MDLNTKLEDEVLFSANESGCKRRVGILKKKGIFTIEDFINTDIDSLISTKEIAIQFKALQKILRYKYLGETLVQDVILDNKYNKDMIGKLYNDLCRLGFYKASYGYRFKEIVYSVVTRNESDNLKILDFLREIALKSTSSQAKVIAQFYVDYYDKNLNKQQDENISPGSIEDLKKQLVTLVAQVNKLNDKMAELIEQVNSLEGGSITNGRK